MQLAARGFEKTGPATADVLLHIHARMEQRLDTAAFDPIDGHCIEMTAVLRSTTPAR